MQEPLVACLPAGHRLIARQSVEAEDLENEPMIALARKALPGRHKEIVEYFEGEGVFLKFARDAYLPKEALWLVSRGLGVALMTRSSAVPLRPDIVLRPLSNQLLTVKSGVFGSARSPYRLHQGIHREGLGRDGRTAAQTAKIAIAINSMTAFVNGQHINSINYPGGYSMRNLYVVSIAGLFFLAACNNAKKPSDANFTNAINQYLAKQGEACTMLNRQFPLDVPKGQQKDQYGIGPNWWPWSWPVCCAAATRQRWFTGCSMPCKARLRPSL